MPHYHLVFTSGDTPVRSVSFSARDPAEALLIAKRHNARVQLWKEDEYVCTIEQSGQDCGFWIISKEMVES